MELLRRHLGGMNAFAALRTAEQRARDESGALAREPDLAALVDALKFGLPRYLGNPQALAACLRELEALSAPVPRASPALSPPPPARVARADVSSAPKAGPPPGSSKVVPIDKEPDLVLARTLTRELAAELAFSPVEQVKLATAVSELARNILMYAKTGTVELRPMKGDPPGLEIVATDHGPGIANLDAILAGNYRSKLGMGMGLRGTKRLVDEMEVRTAPGQGTTVRVRRMRR